MKKVKAEIWSVKVCNGALDMVHGFFFYIKEFYIREYGIAFNYVDNEVHIFRSDDDRYNSKNAEKIETVNIPDDLVGELHEYLEADKIAKKNAKKFIAKYFPVRDKE